MQSQRNDKVIRNIRRLIWVYFWLLIFEGALRKWVVPRLSDPLLIIRDPVVVAIYVLAIKAHIWPKNRFIYALGVIAGLSWFVSVLVLQQYFPIKPLLFVTAYGFRSNFLHLPLIFVIAKVFDREEVKRMGWWFLLVLIPLAALVTVQFSASPDAFVNRTAGTGEGLQITAGGGKIRPPGTFSFVSGMIFYAAACAAFLLHAGLVRGIYRNWLLYAGGFALVVATAVSGSRSVLLSELVVISMLVVIFFTRPSALGSFGRNVLIAVVLLLLASRLPFFKQGVDILSDRFTESAEATQTTVATNLIDRVIEGFTEGLSHLDRIPWAGYGLGLGTNAAAKVLVGRTIFLLSEGEWPRVLLESGPVLGLAFIGWRVAFTVWLGSVCYRSLRGGEILPIILYGSCFLTLLNGQFGQPTNLGFAVLLGGLCLASTEREYYRKRPVAAEAPPPPEQSRRLPRRSAYAERLHDRTSASGGANGSVDR